MTVGGAQILARTEALSWSREAVSAYGSLYRAAQDSAYSTLRGRGPVPVLTNPEGTGPPWVVRHYFRGGLMRPFGDRFLRAGTPRSFVEVENSARIEDLGFATPRIVAAAVYPGGLLYRADLVTELVPHARTLADALVGENGPSGARAGGNARREAIACAAELITRLARAGVQHPDLNAENVLIARGAQRVHAILLDLDGCRVARPSVPVDAARLRRRLARSIRKLERTRPHFQNDGEGRLTNDEIDQLLSEGKAS
jgi:3-deoxy-D-manno-octulosonic acid kinase